MHPALLVSELLTIIFRHLQSLESCSLDSPKRSLTSCAVTCRAWKEPALRIIWEQLDSLLPLMRLFPTDAFSNGSHAPTFWRFKRSLRPSDWTAYTRYSTLVRHLAFREGRDVVASALIALVVQRPAHFQRNPLLPNLVSLKWTASVDTSLTLCAILVPPGLGSLTINLVGAETYSAERNDTTGGLLCTIADLAPNLKELHLNIDKLWAVSDVVIPIKSLCKLETLTLDVGSIGAYIVRGLCQHPTIRKFVIDLCGVEESFLTHLLAHRAQAGEFPALEEMILLADINIVNTTLSNLIRAPLTRLAISTFTLAHTDSLAHCFMHIAENSPNLTSLTLITSLLDSTLHQPLKLAHLSPLAALRDLAVLSIELGFPIQLDDAGLISFIQGLPCLTSLVLSPAPEWAPAGWRPRTTMRSLEWISQYAPQITNLGVALDLSIESTVEVPVETPRQENTLSMTPPYYECENKQHQPLADCASVEKRMQPAESQLRTLFVGASYPRLGKPKEVSAKLKALFPLLDTLRYSNAPRKYSGTGSVWSPQFEAEWASVAADVCGEIPSDYKRKAEEEDDIEYWDGMEVDMDMMDAGVEADEYEWRLAEGIAA